MRGRSLGVFGMVAANTMSDARPAVDASPSRTRAATLSSTTGTPRATGPTAVIGRP